MTSIKPTVLYGSGLFHSNPIHFDKLKAQVETDATHQDVNYRDDVTWTLRFRRPSRDTNSFLRQLNEVPKNSPIIMVGHSRGCHEIREVIRKLKQSGNTNMLDQIKHVIQICPITDGGIFTPAVSTLISDYKRDLLSVGLRGINLSRLMENDDIVRQFFVGDHIEMSDDEFATYRDAVREGESGLLFGKLICESFSSRQEDPLPLNEDSTSTVIASDRDTSISYPLAADFAQRTNSELVTIRDGSHCSPLLKDNHVRIVAETIDAKLNSLGA